MSTYIQITFVACKVPHHTYITLTKSYYRDSLCYLEAPLRPLRGVCGAHLHQANRPCLIGVIPSQTWESYIPISL